MSFLDEFLLHYLDNFFYIIYKEEESPYRNETTKNVYPAGEVFNALVAYIIKIEDLPTFSDIKTDKLIGFCVVDLLRNHLQMLNLSYF